MEMTLELPPDYERFLEEHLEDIAGREVSRVEFDLQGLPAISSRQLGLMLALQKTLRSRFGTLPLRGVSDGVRRLLALTQTARFFQIES